MRNSKKRAWTLIVALAAAAGLGACADEPMGVEEPYEVQMNVTDDPECVIINGQMHCNG